MKKIIFGIALLASLSGCSTIIQGTSDKVTVVSPDKESKLYVDDVLVGTGGATFQAKRGQAYSLKAEKAGCETAYKTTTNTFDPTTLLGVFVDFGIVSIPVDLISGAAFKASETQISLNPVCTK